MQLFHNYIYERLKGGVEVINSANEDEPQVENKLFSACFDQGNWYC